MCVIRDFDRSGSLNERNDEIADNINIGCVSTKKIDLWIASFAKKKKKTFVWSESEVDVASHVQLHTTHTVHHGWG